MEWILRNCKKRTILIKKISRKLNNYHILTTYIRKKKAYKTKIKIKIWNIKHNYVKNI